MGVEETGVDLNGDPKRPLSLRVIAQRRQSHSTGSLRLGKSWAQRDRPTARGIGRPQVVYRRFPVQIQIGATVGKTRMSHCEFRIEGLAPYQDDYVQQTVAALKEMNIDYVIPLHCTGEPFYDKARAEIPGKILRSYTGTRFVFS